MKQLTDGSQKTARSYYFLLAWNEQDNGGFINQNFNKNSLHELSKSEYKQLWQFATELEHTQM